MMLILVLNGQGGGARLEVRDLLTLGSLAGCFSHRDGGANTVTQLLFSEHFLHFQLYLLEYQRT